VPYGNPARRRARAGAAVIARLEGVLAEKRPDGLLLDVSGVG